MDIEVVTCGICGESFPITEVVNVHSEVGIIHCCNHCVEQHTWKCWNCGELFVLGKGWELVDGYRVCEDCISADYYYCESCERYVFYDEWSTEQGCCYDCADRNSDLIGEYHSSEFCFVGETKKFWKGKWRGLGFELEVEASKRNNERELANAIYSEYSKLTLERDGSLDDGFEIISYPHTIKAFYECNWEKILELCKEHGYTSHDSGNCGLHVHVSRYLFGATEKVQQTALSKLLWFYENYWEDMKKLSRRNDYQIADWARQYGVSNKKDVKKIGKGEEGRYHAINLTNPFTVEFRLARGTLNTKTFYAWLDICLTLVRNSKKITWKQIEDKELWLKGLKSETKEYIANKNAFGKENSIICA